MKIVFDGVKPTKNEKALLINMALVDFGADGTPTAIYGTWGMVVMSRKLMPPVSKYGGRASFQLVIPGDDLSVLDEIHTALREALARAGKNPDELLESNPYEALEPCIQQFGFARMFIPNVVETFLEARK